MEISELLRPFNRTDYQRNNFDSFLHANKFSFTIPSIHITGTNGKGTTSSYLAAIYQGNGYRVGKFSSPWLFEINEMITVNDEGIPDADFVRLFKQFEKQFKEFDLSIFEIQTFIAFNYFIEQKCDICVIECGMGGEIDATNIFTPILSIITSVSLEHTEYLGHTISEIAMQKCGIIKEEVPVLISEFDEDANTTICRDAVNKKSPIHYIKTHLEKSLTPDGWKFTYFPYGEIHLKSFAEYSVNDACFALEAVMILENRFPIDSSKIYSSLSNVKMPCRFDIVSTNPLVILDGAHNPEAAKATVNALFAYVHKPIHVVFACFRDKNLGALLSSFGSLGNDLTLTTFPHYRARKEEEFFLFLGDYKFEENAVELLKRKMAEFPDDAIVVTGSLAFASYIKKEVF